jgi:hypothetical protein
MASTAKIEAIAGFIIKHPETTASRRICREILGESLEHFNQEFAEELTHRLSGQNELQIESYYRMIR